MTTFAAETDSIVTSPVSSFPKTAHIMTMIAHRLRHSVRPPEIPRLLRRDVITMPGVRANGCDWLFQALNRLRLVAALPSGWDGEGGPPPNPETVASAARLLRDLQRNELPLPFICPIAGGGLQIEWSCAEREVELELVDQQTMAFLRVENATTGKTVESGEYPISDINKSRELLDWLASA